MDEVEIWRDNDGTPAAYGYARGGTYWIEYPGVGTFRFAAAGTTVDAVAAAETPPERLRGAFRRAILPLALQALGSEVLHASGVLTQNGGIALCGKSEAGKSTLAYGLQQRGYRAFADDAVVVDVSSTGARVSGIPFAIRLRSNPLSTSGVSTETGTRSPRPTLISTTSRNPWRQSSRWSPSGVQMPRSG